MTAQRGCRSCGNVHEANVCICGHVYHGHGHGLDFVVGEGRCLNCSCGRYEPDGEVRWTMGDEGRAADFAEIMRRLQSRTPEELVLMAADTELAVIQARILGEELMADREMDEGADES